MAINKKILANQNFANEKERTLPTLIQPKCDFAIKTNLSDKNSDEAKLRGWKTKEMAGKATLNLRGCNCGAEELRL